MRKLRWIIGIPVALLVAVSVGVWVFINVIEGDPPAKLSLGTTATTGTSGTTAAGTTAAGTTATTGGTPGGGVDGTWSATNASQVGYRAKEVLFGQSATAVGRTDAVTGEVVIDGTTVDTATFTADLTKVSSNQDRRGSSATTGSTIRAADPPPSRTTARSSSSSSSPRNNGSLPSLNAKRARSRKASSPGTPPSR